MLWRLAPLAVLLTWPAVARAELELCAITGLGGDGAPLFVCASPTSCVADSDCEGVLPDGHCGPTVAGHGRFCVSGCSTLMRCDVHPDCPALRGVAGNCVEVPFPDGSSTGVCAYGFLDAARYCSADGAPEDLRSFLDCHRDPTRLIVSNWYEGNCDGDPCPNGSDPDPCVDDPGTSCAFRMDLGPFCDVSSADAGMGTIDASVIDASILLDANAELDAPGGLDGGSPPDADVDAMAPDVPPFDAAGIDAPGVDAPSSRPPVIRFGGGGCSCTAHDGGTPGSLLVGLAVMAARWRRRSA